MGHECEPNSLRNMFIMAGGPAQDATIAFAIFTKKNSERCTNEYELQLEF